MRARPLKLISLNIEMDRHLDRIIPFFKEQRPDVILLQEVLDNNVEQLEKSTGMNGIYTIQNIICFEKSASTAIPTKNSGPRPSRRLGLSPTKNWVKTAAWAEKSESYLGLLTLSNLPIIKNSHVFYRGDGAQPQRMTMKEPEKTARAVSNIEIVKDQQTYCLLNTHFTWTPNAQPNDDQQQDLEHVLRYLADIPEFIFCGDFNAPRGTRIFDTIATTYQDNIPKHITTTIDKQLHRCGDLGIVVDGVFTTPGYDVIDVQVVDNLSDHCAIVTLVEPKPNWTLDRTI